MEITLTTAAIATITSAIISAAVTLFINWKNEMKYLNEQLDSILKISLQYPFLENPDFVNTWCSKKNSNEDDVIRYEIYCTLLFNYFARLFKHFKYNKTKIDEFISARYWIKLHKDYWLNPIDSFENSDSYEQEFKNLISEYLN